MSTRVFQDTFVRANSAAGNPGNSWTDGDGNVWGITSDQMVSTNNFSPGGTSNTGRSLYRPAGEVTQNSGKDQAAVCYFLGLVGSTRTFTTAAFPVAPSAGDAFAVIGQGP